MKGFPKRDENLSENIDGYHIFGQNIKYQYPQKVLLDEKYLHKIEPEKPILAYTSSASEIGMIAESFYRSGDNGAFQGLFPKFKDYNKKHILYFLATLSKYFVNFGYSTGMSNILSLVIPVPYVQNKLAFKYMENYIKALEAERIETLEAERIETLEAYLTVTNLRDYHLTKNDEKVLDKFAKLSDTKSRVEESEAFRLSPVTMITLFPNIHQGRRLKKDDQINGDLPFVMAGTTNTGVVRNIGNDVRVFPKQSLTIDIFGNTFYRGYEFGAGDDTGVFWNDKMKDSKALLYLKTIIEKSLIGKYDFGSKLRASQTHNFKFDVPQTNNQIDYQFMSDFIRVVEKLVIKDLVIWADKKIAATKEVVDGV